MVDDAPPNTSRPSTPWPRTAWPITAAEERRAQLDQQRAALDAELRSRRGQHAAALRRLAEAQAKAQATRRRLERDGVAAGAARRADRPAGGTPRRLPAAKPPKSRWSWPSARSGCGTSAPACGSSRKTARNAHRAIDEAREHLAECVRRAEASRWNILAGGSRDRRPLSPQGVVRRADRRPGQPARSRSTSSGPR